MIFTILTIISSAVFTIFTGYWAHRAFHQKWSGPFYSAHQNHHMIQYPPENFTSDTYRSAGQDNTLWYFTLAFSPIMIMVAASHFLLGISIWTCICILTSMIGTGLLHNYMHDGFHLNKSFWGYLPGFNRLQELHRIHHEQMNYNFGIFSFLLDKAFKTYKDTK